MCQWKAIKGYGVLVSKIFVLLWLQENSRVLFCLTTENSEEFQINPGLIDFGTLTSDIILSALFLCNEMVEILSNEYF